MRALWWPADGDRAVLGLMTACRRGADGRFCLGFLDTRRAQLVGVTPQAGV